eukprot:6740414-Pyramimonas_sp.AAC.2
MVGLLSQPLDPPNNASTYGTVIFSINCEIANRAPPRPAAVSGGGWCCLALGKLLRATGETHGTTLPVGRRRCAWFRNLRRVRNPISQTSHSKNAHAIYWNSRARGAR